MLLLLCLFPKIIEPKAHLLLSPHQGGTNLAMSVTWRLHAFWNNCTECFGRVRWSWTVTDHNRSNKPRAWLFPGAKSILIEWLIGHWRLLFSQLFLKNNLCTTFCPFICYIPSSFTSAFHVCMHSILTTPWGGYYDYPHFTDKETKAQRG